MAESNIHPSLEFLSVPIDKLVLLEGNPRKGNIDAIASSYTEFGQIKPIVVRPNDDGTSTVIAGNHQLQAAKLLGWDRIAVVSYEVDDTRALAFALADNRTMELGYTEIELLNELILNVSDVYPELLEDLGWDKFDLAEVEQQSIRDSNDIVGVSGQYVSPVITNLRGSQNEEDNYADDETPQSNSGHKAIIDSPSILITQNDDGSQFIELNKDASQNDVAVRGSTIAAPGSAPRAAVQYALMFDDVAQQAAWYDFIKYLKSNSDYEGATFAAKLIAFISEHSE